MFEEFIEWGQTTEGNNNNKFPDKQYAINNNALLLLFNRYQEAPPQMRHMTAYYEDPIWQETQDRAAAPYMPAIIRHWEKNR